MDKLNTELQQSSWNHHHSLNYKNPDDNYVTHSSFSEINGYHKLPDLDDKHTVLDIGVGHGALVKYFSEKGCKTIGCDISDVALDQVSKYCHATFLSKDIEQCEPVDYAIGHLVFQHNFKNEVQRIINEVPLKDDGIFSFQIASLNPVKGRDQFSELIINDVNKSMLYFYSLENILSIIESTNKEVVEVSEPIWFDKPFSFDWYIIKVKNK